MPAGRVMVIDEDLNERLARELRNRGRRARAVTEIGLRGEHDTTVLRKVFELFDDVILITGDDSMPADHAGTLSSIGATVATVTPWDEDTAYVGTWEGRTRRNEEEWEQEIVHRWAHAMEDQTSGSVRRYALLRHGVWKPARRR